MRRPASPTIVRVENNRNTGECLAEANVQLDGFEGEAADVLANKIGRVTVRITSHP